MVPYDIRQIGRLLIEFATSFALLNLSIPVFNCLKKDMLEVGVLLRPSVDMCPFFVESFYIAAFEGDLAHRPPGSLSHEAFATTPPSSDFSKAFARSALRLLFSSRFCRRSSRSFICLLSTPVNQ